VFGLCEDLCRRYSENAEYWARLAATHQILGNGYLLQGRNAEAEPLFRRGMELFESALNMDADKSLDRCDDSGNIALGDYALTAMSLGTALWRTNRSEDAERSYPRSVELLESLLTKDPKRRDRDSLAVVLMNLGGLQASTGQFEKSQASL
jgi:tetratricopeptide (TPR) repeat protein